MALKDILVHLDTGARTNARLATAATLARRHGARLTGLFVVNVPESALFYGGAVPYATAGVDLVAQTRAEIVASSKPVEAHFRDFLAREGLEGEYRIYEGRTPQVVALHTRYADLTVLGQPNGAENDDGDDVVVNTLMSAGRPVLLVPYVGDYAKVGERVLVAWNASREATRAVADAMPMLQAASQVTVLAINPQHGIHGHGDVPAADIALHLARHGVKAEATHTVSGSIPDGETLLSYAADVSADMIVAGGYGHSRARELVFGGVTQTLLREMTVPILLSH
ncbi:MAG: universal stress protein [Acetobacteraceae bacterium]